MQAAPAIKDGNERVANKKNDAETYVELIAQTLLG